MVQLDERLHTIADMVIETIAGVQSPCVADVGCDHGQLTAYLLERCGALTMIASDVSGPSLAKARRLLSANGMESRAQIVQADGLAGVDRPVHAIVMAGMGAETMLGIIRAGREKIGDAALIMQANVDLPLLRRGLAELGFAVERECFSVAAGRHYAVMLARAGETRTLEAREALLGTAVHGVQNEAQQAYFAWQRGVRVRELEQTAALCSEKARARRAVGSRELDWIAEAMGVNGCTVREIERLVGEIAPYALAEAWDNVGLLVGHAEHRVTRVLTALDLTAGVVEEAKALGAQVILTHHPIMMDARKRMTDADREGRLLLALAENGIAHIAAHTNLDSAPGGVNDTLLARFGAQNVRGEGFVRAGELEGEMTFDQLCTLAQRRLHAAVRAYGAADTPVRCIGCCSGAGGSCWEEAKALGADCFITGEIKHHIALEAMDAQMCVIEAGHFETENPVCEVMANALQNACDALKYNVTVFCSKGNPFGR